MNSQIAKGSVQLYKKPCTQCGRCCKEEVCLIGVAFLDTDIIPCPALKQIGGKYFCGLVVVPEEFVFPTIGLSEQQYVLIKEHMIERFSFGVGCDAAEEEG